MKKNIFKSILILLILVLMSLLIILIYKKYNDKYIDYIDYIIKHKNNIITSNSYKNENYYLIDTCYFNYYTDITIRKISDSSLFIIFWGDRDSWLWNYKSDKIISFDIPYDRYHGNDVSKYVKLINILDSINNKDVNIIKKENNIVDGLIINEFN